MYQIDSDAPCDGPIPAQAEIFDQGANIDPPSLEARNGRGPTAPNAQWLFFRSKDGAFEGWIPYLRPATYDAGS